jgi:hypothetical protein
MKPCSNLKSTFRCQKHTAVQPNAYLATQQRHCSHLHLQSCPKNQLICHGVARSKAADGRIADIVPQRRLGATDLDVPVLCFGRVILAKPFYLQASQTHIILPSEPVLLPTTGLQPTTSDMKSSPGQITALKMNSQ